MDLKRGSHSCISSWWRVTQIPVLCASVDSPLTRISTTIPCMYSYLCHLVVGVNGFNGLTSTWQHLYC